MPEFKTVYGENAFVKVSREGRNYRYTPVKVKVDTKDGKIDSSVHCMCILEDGGFDDLAKAQAMVERYNEGPSLECTEARWDANEGYWIELSHEESPSSWRDDPEAQAERRGYTW